jgi:hypothetical protein
LIPGLRDAGTYLDRCHVGIILDNFYKKQIMDNKSKRGPQDSSRINVNEDYELRYWTDKFGVSDSELKKAVSKVGVSAAAVEDYFKSKK